MTVLMSPRHLIAAIKITAEKNWFAFLAAGAAFVLIGALGEVPGIGVLRSAIDIEVLGVLLLMCSAIFALMEVRKTSSPKNAAIVVGTYGPSIVEPAQGSTVLPPFKVSGRVKKVIPRGYQLWLMSEAQVEGDRVWWPHEAVSFTGAKEWSVRYAPGPYSDKDKKTLRLCLVGEEGQKLIAAYRRINKRLIGDRSTPWEGLTNLSSDMELVEPQLLVYLAKPTDSRAVPQVQRH